MSQLGKGKLKTAMIIEVAVSLMFILAECLRFHVSLCLSF